jgi:hypothetical protein
MYHSPSLWTFSSLLSFVTPKSSTSNAQIINKPLCVNGKRCDCRKFYILTKLDLWIYASLSREWRDFILSLTGFNLVKSPELYVENTPSMIRKFPFLKPIVEGELISSSLFPRLRGYVKRIDFDRYFPSRCNEVKVSLHIEMNSETLTSVTNGHDNVTIRIERCSLLKEATRGTYIIGKEIADRVLSGRMKLVGNVTYEGDGEDVFNTLYREKEIYLKGPVIFDVSGYDALGSTLIHDDITAPHCIHFMSLLQRGKYPECVSLLSVNSLSDDLKFYTLAGIRKFKFPNDSSPEHIDDVVSLTKSLDRDTVDLTFHVKEEIIPELTSKYKLMKSLPTRAYFCLVKGPFGVILRMEFICHPYVR